MKAYVAPSHHFVQTRDGHLWTTNSSLAYSFWTRYLDVFSDVVLLARARRVKKNSDDFQKVTGERVSAFCLPSYEGALGYLRHLSRMYERLAQLDTADGALFLRVPLAHAREVLQSRPTNQPYGVEVVGDPWDSCAPGAMRHILRPLIRAILAARLRTEVREATAAAYVTREALQRRYPSHPTAGSFYYSSVSLTQDAFAWRGTPTALGVPSLVTVGTLNQMYKGPAVLLNALNTLKNRGVAFQHTWIGGGKYRAEMENLAGQLGLSDSVRFTGMLSRRQVVETLDHSDLFVLPSYQEGLPRALLEAMARGLPCISTSVGGVPELLTTDALVPAGDSVRLAHAIQLFITSAELRENAAAHNYRTAKAYAEDQLRERRIRFYSHVRDRTLRWQAKHT